MRGQSALPGILDRRLSRRRAIVSGISTLGALYLAACTTNGTEEAPTPVATTRPVPPQSPVEISSASWRQLQPSGLVPEPRRDHSLVVDPAGSHVWLFGGRSDTNVFDDLWLFDVTTGRWSRMPSVGERPLPRFGHNAVFDSARGRVMVFGGQAGDEFFSDVWAFDVDDGAWTRLGDDAAGPQPRYGAGGDYDPQRELLYVSHGFTDQGRFDDTWTFSPGGESWEEVSPAEGPRPIKRCLMRAVLDPDHGRLLLFGGQTDDNPFLDDLWSFDTVEHRWTESMATRGPAPRNLYSAVRSDATPHLVLFGGNKEVGPDGELWLFDLSLDRWLRLDTEEPKPSPRYSHDAVWLPASRSMLLFGGRSDGDLNDLWELTLS